MPGQRLSNEKRERNRQRNKEYREANKERLNERSRQWYRDHRQAALSKRKEYRESQKELATAADRRHYETHRDAILAQKRAYYQANKEKIAEKGQQYRQDPKVRDARLAAMREWWANNEAHLREYRLKTKEKRAAQDSARWRADADYRARSAARQKTPEGRDLASRQREKNKDSQRELAKAWAKRNPDKIAAKHRSRRARVAGSNGKHTAEDVSQIWKRQGRKCAVPGCAHPITTDAGKYKFHVDHVTPLASGGRNDKANLQILCAHHNSEKSDMDPYKWAQMRLGSLFVK